MMRTCHVPWTESIEEFIAAGAAAPDTEAVKMEDLDEMAAAQHGALP